MAKNIVLLHGWGAGPGKLELLAGALRKLGWAVVIPTLPGLSGSDPGGAWGVGDYAKCVEAKLPRNFRPQGYVVFGHSFGGRVAIKLGAHQVEGLRGIVLCAAGGLSRPWSFKRVVFWVLAKLGKLLMIYPPLAVIYRRLLYGAAGEHDYEKTSGVMRETFKKVVAEILVGDLSKIKVSTLILWGKQDRTVPYHDGVLANQKITKSKLVLVEGQGHRLPYEMPDYLASQINIWFGSLR